MQVDYDASKEKKDLEVGGYEDDSDDEIEKKEIAEAKSEYFIKLTEQGANLTELENATLIVLSGLHAQTMGKIMYGADWVEVGEGIKQKVKKDDDKDSGKDKDKTILKLYVIPQTSFYLALPDVEKMSGGAVNPTVGKLFQTLTTIKKVVVLKDLYKTKYPNPDELYGLPDGVIPMKTHRTSFLSDGEIEWLTQKVGTPAHFMAVAGGFGAACLVECEMTGRPGY